jgi:hypothetical protein
LEGSDQSSYLHAITGNLKQRTSATMGAGVFRLSSQHLFWLANTQTPFSSLVGSHPLVPGGSRSEERTLASRHINGGVGSSSPALRRLCWCFPISGFEGKACYFLSCFSQLRDYKTEYPNRNLKP